MNWDAIGAVGELVGAAAVVVTLIFLTIQLRQNTKVAYWQMTTTNLQTWEQLHIDLARDPELFRLWQLILHADPEDVSREDRGRCFELFEAFMSVMEPTIAAVIEFPDAARNRGIDDGIAFIGQCKFAGYIWDRVKARRMPEFQNAVERVRAQVTAGA